MTQAFLIVVRILALGLIGYWGYRLWTGTTSWVSRSLSGVFVGMLAWQVLFGAFS